MINTNAPRRLPWARSRIVEGSLVPMPVRVTMPITIPTQAAAEINGITSRPAWVKASRIRFAVSRVRALNALTATMATSATLTDRNTV